MSAEIPIDPTRAESALPVASVIPADLCRVRLWCPLARPADPKDEKEAG
jgi:hypothetical protein